MAHSEKGGHSGGQSELNTETVADLKLRAFVDLTRALLMISSLAEGGRSGLP